MPNESLSLTHALISVPVMGLVIFLLRVFPFAFFSKKEPPVVFNYIGKYLPPLVMAILIIYTLQSVDFATKPYGFPHIAGCLFTVIMHMWKKNAMISIFGGTIVYMLLLHLI